MGGSEIEMKEELVGGGVGSVGGARLFREV